MKKQSDYTKSMGRHAGGDQIATLKHTAVHAADLKDAITSDLLIERGHPVNHTLFKTG